MAHALVEADTDTTWTATISTLHGGQIGWCRYASAGVGIQIISQTALRRTWSIRYAPAAIAVPRVANSAAANPRCGALATGGGAISWTIGCASAVARIQLVAGFATAHSGENAVATLATAMAMWYASLTIAGWIDVSVI